MLLFPTKRACFDLTENSFGGDPTLRRFAGTSIEGCFRVLHPNDAVRLVKRVYSNIAVVLENLTIGDGAKMLRKFNNFAPSPIVKKRFPTETSAGKIARRTVFGGGWGN